MVNRIVEKSLELMQDAYGNYVVQYVLDVCSDEDVHAVCESVIGKVNLLAIQKFSSGGSERRHPVVTPLSEQLGSGMREVFQFGSEVGSAAELGDKRVPGLGRLEVTH